MSTEAAPRRRLTPRELGIVRFIGRHQAAGLRVVSLGKQLRKLATPLWRDGLIEIWYRQMPGMRPALRGPHYSLSHSGRCLASRLDLSRTPANQRGTS